MNNRIILVAMTVAVVTTTSGCTPFRNFFFGRGANCGLCTRLSTPLRRQAPLAAAQPTCNQPLAAQPRYTPPAAGYGCNPDPCATGYAPAARTMSAYPADPYCCPPGYGAAQGGIVNGQGYIQPYSGAWQPRPTDSQGYRANYWGYPDVGYRVDADGDRIIYEEPLPDGARAVN
ncbi:hypothetical protein Enr13x_47970 [Stieleria neptunia]|uniref:Uncharacterized protein n=1 Tax=Stieleria neptunia TaxID=2527979 RepID=A0A518HVQ1_9BACT|nr:hypothetical protein [Stieleria neptunia]QDV44926.1 hypothetical protein Enr13x_47970 [Stieleria neptunia]